MTERKRSSTSEDNSPVGNLGASSCWLYVIVINILCMYQYVYILSVYIYKQLIQTILNIVYIYIYT